MAATVHRTVISNGSPKVHGKKVNKILSQMNRKGWVPVTAPNPKPYGKSWKTEVEFFKKS